MKVLSVCFFPLENSVDEDEDSDACDSKETAMKQDNKAAIKLPKAKNSVTQSKAPVARVTKEAADSTSVKNESKATDESPAAACAEKSVHSTTTAGKGNVPSVPFCKS